MPTIIDDKKFKYKFIPYWKEHNLSATRKTFDTEANKKNGKE